MRSSGDRPPPTGAPGSARGWAHSRPGTGTRVAARRRDAAGRGKRRHSGWREPPRILPAPLGWAPSCPGRRRASGEALRRKRARGRRLVAAVARCSRRSPRPRRAGRSRMRDWPDRAPESSRVAWLPRRCASPPGCARRAPPAPGPCSLSDHVSQRLCSTSARHRRHHARARLRERARRAERDSALAQVPDLYSPRPHPPEARHRKAEVGRPHRSVRAGAGPRGAATRRSPRATPTRLEEPVSTTFQGRHERV